MKELSRIALAIEPSATMAIDSMFKQMKAEGLDVTVTMVDHRRVLEVRVAVAAEAPEAAEGAAQH